MVEVHDKTNESERVKERLKQASNLAVEVFGQDIVKPNYQLGWISLGRYLSDIGTIYPSSDFLLLKDEDYFPQAQAFAQAYEQRFIQKSEGKEVQQKKKGLLGRLANLVRCRISRPELRTEQFTIQTDYSERS